MPVKLTTASKPFSRNSTERVSTKGLTLVELLVGASIGLIILSTAFALTLSSRKLYDMDRSRTEINQNLRTTSDIVGAGVRIAGERLGSRNNFPVAAIEIRNGTELVLRRNMLDATLPLCEKKLNTNEDNICVSLKNDGQGVKLADSPQCAAANSDSDGDGVPDALAAWRAYRQKYGPEVGGYIFTNGTGKKDFFVYDGDDGSDFKIHTKTNRVNIYEISERPILILVEETTYRLRGDTLERVLNQNEDKDSGKGKSKSKKKEENENKVQQLANNLSNFQVRAIMKDGSVLKDYTGAGTAWTDLVAIEVSLTGRISQGGKPLERTFTSRFFPRNVLSN
ncbi:hypothetical protein BH24DEI2_BH24DEI2_03910 [soil metagenome]